MVGTKSALVARGIQGKLGRRLGRRVDQRTSPAVAAGLVHGFQNTPHRDALLDYAYGRLRFQAALAPHARPAPAMPPGMVRAPDVIEHDYVKPIGIDALARAAGWSPRPTCTTSSTDTSGCRPTRRCWPAGSAPPASA